MVINFGALYAGDLRRARLRDDDRGAADRELHDGRDGGDRNWGEYNTVDFVKVVHQNKDRKCGLYTTLQLETSPLTESMVAEVHIEREICIGLAFD